MHLDLMNAVSARLGCEFSLGTRCSVNGKLEGWQTNPLPCSVLKVTRSSVEGMGVTLVLELFVSLRA